MQKITLCLLIAILAGFAVGKSYEGFKAYRVFATTRADARLLIHFENNKDFDFWTSPNRMGQPVDIMVAPKSQALFEHLLKKYRVSYKILLENIESTIQRQRNFYKNRSQKREGGISFDQYWRHADINAYLEQLADDHSDIVKVETIGQSYENRDMKVIRISNATNPGTNPVIFVDAGIHAREWIAPAVALYIINQLVENPENSGLIENVDWIVLPSLNPDGYEFTWTDDRLWRKTRSPGKECDGVDANRNFGFHWGEDGGSDDECSEIYSGPEVFSELETQAVRDFVLKEANVELYVTLHSFSQVIIYPWSYTYDAPDDADELQKLGELAASAITAIRGTEYDVGETTDVMYPAAGASHDWAKGGANVSLSYTIELPGGGDWGFDPPEEDILPIVTETFEGFRAFHDYIEQKFKKQ